MDVKDGGDGFDSIRESMFVPFVVEVDATSFETTVIVWFLKKKSRPSIYVLL